MNGTHQCDFLNFCGDLGPQLIESKSEIIKKDVAVADLWCAVAVLLLLLLLLLLLVTCAVLSPPFLCCRSYLDVDRPIPQLLS